MRFRSPEGELSFLKTITTFAGPRDVTLDEMRIECAYPADDQHGARLRPAGSVTADLTFEVARP